MGLNMKTGEHKTWTDIKMGEYEMGAGISLYTVASLQVLDVSYVELLKFCTEMKNMCNTLFMPIYLGNCLIKSHNCRNRATKWK